uniref:Protein kinase domain-containing protein n=1 Tax=Amphora coffeiformis TaxID=265554 RepID=A0A7S3L452_9STRA
MEALGRLSPRFSPSARNVEETMESSSAASPTGLYAVVHDLTEMEYTCCDPMGFVNKMFTQPEDEHDVGLAVIEEQQGDYSTNTRSDSLTKEKNLDLDEIQSRLQTPDLTETKRKSLQDSFDEDEIPTLPRPTFLQHRAVSWDAKDMLTTTKSPPRYQSPYHTPIRRHQRAYSEGYGKSWAAMPKTEIHGKERRFEDDYVLTRQIFKCEYSTVSECVDRLSGERYCVKTMEHNIKSKDEVKRLKQAQCRYAVKLVEVIHEEDTIYIIMEFLAGGNLLSRIIQKGTLSEGAAKRMARRLIQAILHMHQNQFLCHNDLHPSNILFESDTSTSRLKLADFGATTTCTSAASTVVCLSNQPPYRAPERQASEASDMWSVGVIIFFCLFGKQSCLEQGYNDLLDHLHKVPKAGEKRPHSRHAKQFICNLVHLDPEVRMTAQEALWHPWLNNGNHNRVENIPSPPVISDDHDSPVRDAAFFQAVSDHSGRRGRRPGKRIVKSFARLKTLLGRPRTPTITTTTPTREINNGSEESSSLTKSVERSSTYSRERSQSFS